MLRLWRSLFVLALALTLYATLAPLRGQSVGIPGLDKVVHFALFALNGWLGWLAFPERGRKAVVVGLIVLGPLLEILQGYVPNRFPSVADGAANWLGLAAGFIAARRGVGSLDAES